MIILMGSKTDLPLAQEIGAALDRFNVPYEYRVASAHKSVRHLIKILEEYEADAQPKVYITIAGRSNALSGLVDANVTAPVIACPPYSDRFGGADIFSSLRMPSGIAPAVVLEPEGAAILAAKILSLLDSALRQRLQKYHEQMTEQILLADREIAAQCRPQSSVRSP